MAICQNPIPNQEVVAKPVDYEIYQAIYTHV